MPSGSCAATNSACDDAQNWHSFSDETYAAISSRSPLVRVLGPRSSTSASSVSGRAVAGLKRNRPSMPGSSLSVICGIRALSHPTERHA
jgi:hypothetical protein